MARQLWNIQRNRYIMSGAQKYFKFKKYTQSIVFCATPERYPIAALPLPSTGNIPPPGPNLNATYTPNRGNTPPNPQKWYNNWNYCYTCGFDIKQGHTSLTCAYPNAHHQPACTQNNVDQYAALGHRPSLRARHKINLSVNPGPHQA